VKDWKPFALKEITTKIGSGSTPKGGKEAYFESGITLVRSLNIYDFVFALKDLAFINGTQAKKLNGVTIEKEDILLNITGASVGRCTIIPENLLPARVNQHVSIIRCDKTKAYSRFLLYCINSTSYKDALMSIADTGATREALTKEDLEKFPILLPPLPIQHRIASILSTYDELIEVNNQRIKLLEETARALYKEWFVRMRFPGYKQAKFVKGLPEGWVVKPIGKVIDYNIGGGWGNDEKNNLFSTTGYVIRGTDIPGVRIGKANQEVYRFHKASNMKSRELVEGDIVFETAGGSEGQLLGRTCYITQELLDSYGDKVMAASFCKQIRTTSIPSLYLYYFLNYLYDTGMVETFQVQSTGISNYQFEPFLKFQQIILPDDELMQSFHDKTLLMQKEIAILGQQNTQLRQIRERLLPRLISGKLEVKTEKVLLNSETETKYN